MSKPPVSTIIMVLCPVCTEPLKVNIRIQSISCGDGTFSKVVFWDDIVNHICLGPNL